MSNYTPVSSKLYDRLRAAATLNKNCHLTYLDDDNQQIKTQGQIVDVYAADDADWCKLHNNTVIRLDKIEAFEVD